MGSPSGSTQKDRQTVRLVFENAPANYSKAPMTRFRPCIDLHAGKVKQIVGSTLRDAPTDGDHGGRDAPPPTENFSTDRSSAEFAALYQKDRLFGGHVIRLGPGNDQAAREALAAFPGGLQIGGGIRLENAKTWLDAGASHVIVTSTLFDEHGRFDADRLRALTGAIGANRIVIDLSCRRVDSSNDPQWQVCMDRWQRITDLAMSRPTLERLAEHCDEFLIHAADVEGMVGGIDTPLVEFLGRHNPIGCVYAGGIASMADVQRIADASDGRLDYTVGSGLDLFGGTALRYADLIEPVDPKA